MYVPLQPCACGRRCLKRYMPLAACCSLQSHGSCLPRYQWHPRLQPLPAPAAPWPNAPTWLVPPGGHAALEQAAAGALQQTAPLVPPSAGLGMRQRSNPPLPASRVPGCPTAADVVRVGSGHGSQAVACVCIHSLSVTAILDITMTMCHPHPFATVSDVRLSVLLLAARHSGCCCCWQRP
jgi:hypothetical protein